jgi:hypothetical protein
MRHARPAHAQTATHDGRFCSVEHLLEDDAFPGLAALAPALESALPSICAVQHTGGDAYFRLDDARVLAWLVAKTDAVTAALRGGGAGGGAAFEALGAGLTAYSVEFWGEYVSRAWLTRLQERLGCAAAGPVVEGGMAAPMPLASHDGFGADAPNKKPKLTKVRARRALTLAPRICVLSRVSRAPPARRARQTDVQNASRALSLATKNAKASAGTKSLASFFGKPAAK